jgi:hypothetical protein
MWWLMTEPINFQPFLGWVNSTDPDNVSPDARVITAEDLMRYEQLGLDIAAWTAANPGGGGGTPSGGVIDGGTP